ncbi:hypothetical protein HID58_058290, partial [Brassica napus]
ILHNGLPVADNLRKRGINIYSYCQACGEEIETVQHINTFMFEGKFFEADEIVRKAKEEADSWFLAQQVQIGMELREANVSCAEVPSFEQNVSAFEAWELMIGSWTTIRCASFIAQSVRNLGLTQSYVAAGHPRWLDQFYTSDRSASSD